MNLNLFVLSNALHIGMAEKVRPCRKCMPKICIIMMPTVRVAAGQNAVSRERLEMFTPGWEEAIKPTASDPLLFLPSPDPEASQSPMPEKQVPPAPRRL